MRDHSSSMPSPETPRDPSLPPAVPLGGKFSQEQGKYLFYDGDWIEGAHVPSFRHIEAMVGRDENRVYWRDRVLGGADAGSFEIVETYPDPDRSDRLCYVARDRSGAFLLGESRGTAVAGAAPRSFRRLDFDYFSDGQKVFFDARSDVRAIDGALPGSFEPLAFSYARDALHAYYGSVLIKEVADPKSFRHVSGDYACDDANVYYCGKPLAGADVAGFGVVFRVNPESQKGSADTVIPHPSHGLAYDSRRVYQFGRPVEGARPEDYLLDSWFVEPARLEHFPARSGTPKRRPPSEVPPTLTVPVAPTPSAAAKPAPPPAVLSRSKLLTFLSSLVPRRKR
jgi:hypothetical protein